MRFFVVEGGPWSGAGEILHDYGSQLLVRGSEVPEGAEAVDDPRVHVHGAPVEVPEGRFETRGHPRALVRFAGPVALEWRRTLEEAGVRIHAWCPPRGALVRLPEGLVDDAVADAFPFLAGAVGYLEGHCARPVPRDPGLPAPTDVVDVVVFERGDRARVAAALARKGVEVLDSGTTKLRIRWSGDLAEIRDLVGVKLAHRARGPAVPAGHLAPSLGLAGPDGAWMADLDGAGEILHVADTGLDRGELASMHPDLAGRVRSLRSWPANPSWDGIAQADRVDDGPADRGSGHGTAMAGLAVGSGARGGPERRGLAPAAQLVFQALEQHVVVRPEHREVLPTGFYLAGRPLDLRDLWRHGHDEGARVHLAAWGDPVAGAYTDDCFETDLFLAEHPDDLVVFAAGNHGEDRDGDRRPDPGGLHAPATCKSGLAVGATEGPHRGVGFRGDWEDYARDRNRFRDRRDRADPVSGEPDRIALLSATGPTEDGRTKPDLCAPGTNLVTPRSRSSASKGWGLASPMPDYHYLGGTSVSAAVVAGAALLLRQAWTQHQGAPPSGPALKALLVLATRPVLARGSDRIEERRVAGQGRLWVEDGLPADIALLDVARAGLHTGQERRVSLLVPEGGDLRAVLAWYDAPGERLVDDLDLWLEHPDGRRTWGNGGPGADRRNTVEVVEAAALPGGEYTLVVRAFDAPAGPRGFALAWRGAAGEPAEPLPSLDIAVLGVDAATAAATGVHTIRALLQRPPADLQALRPLRALLDLVRAVPRPVGVPASLSVAAVLDDPRPAGVDPVAWEALRGALAALDLVLDPVRRGELLLRHLQP